MSNVPKHIRESRLKLDKDNQEKLTRKIDGFFGNEMVSGSLMLIYIVLLMIFGIPAFYYMIIL